MKRLNLLALSSMLVLCTACGNLSETDLNLHSDKQIITLLEQGSFAVGGTVKVQTGTYNSHQPLNSAGQTLHGDHAYVSFQIPDNARAIPLIFLHGAGQSAKTWESTPDGREGFSTLFLRQRYSTYLIDQPRRGRAGRSTVDFTIKSVPDEQFWFENFRMGCWPDYYVNSKFPQSQLYLEQFFRQMTPNTGDYDAQVISNSLAVLVDKLKSGILVTHSQGGESGWLTALKTSGVKGIVSFEPGSGFIFPEGEVPEPLDSISPFGVLSASAVSVAEFEKLTRFPIIIYYGDNIPSEPSSNWAMDSWRVRMKMARLFADCINRHGGDATVVYLPDLGIKGNSHFLFAEKNNVQIAKLMAQWLHNKKLD